jgi:hypothetical protein
MAVAVVAGAAVAYRASGSAPRPANNLPSGIRDTPFSAGDSPPTPAPDGLEVPNAAPSPAAPAREKQRGVALGLFAEDVTFSYVPLLEEIVALGATHVSLIVPLYQEHASSTSIYRHTRFSPTLETVADVVRLARREGLEVTLFPIVRLAAPRGPLEWRGTLEPSDRGRWFTSYEQHLGDLAALAAMTGATRLVVGSELSSLDHDLDHWRPLIARLRALFAGALVYSANWDHFRDAALLDLVDEVGVTAYFKLREEGAPSDVATLSHRWKGLRDEIESWAARRPQPFVFTEVGYRSRAGASAAPWDETPGGQPDVEEQRRAFEAFTAAWAGSRMLAGVYVWNWYGYGGPHTISYTPRGKPAAEVVKRLLSGL